VGHSSGSVFAWIILRGVSLGFFSGSRVFFFLLGLGGLVGGFLGLVWVLLGFFCIRGLLLGVSFVL
jgi:hypothetical protein